MMDLTERWIDRDRTIDCLIQDIVDAYTIDANTDQCA